MRELFVLSDFLRPEERLGSYIFAATRYRFSRSRYNSGFIKVTLIKNRPLTRKE